MKFVKKPVVSSKGNIMTTLIEAAQKLITCMNLDRIEVGDWPDDSREAYLGLKQAIAQELTSQTAITNPVVSQKTAGAVDKDCDTCNNRQRRMHQEPCFSCHGYTNWEPKP